MGKVVLGRVLIEQKQVVGTADGGGLPLIGVSNKVGLYYSRQERLSNVSRYKLLKKYWFAYNPMRINIGSIGYADADEKTGIISPDYVVFSCSSQILPEYFFYFIKSTLGLKEISKNTGGSVRERLYFKNLSKIEIELPTLSEQERIIQLLKKRKTLLEDIISENDLFEKYTLKLKSCILQKAIQGKLTKQDPTDEPATELLKRIKTEKEKVINGAKLKKEKGLLPIVEDELPFDLPESWVWCRLGEIGQINPRNSCTDDKEVSFVPMTLISSEFDVAPKFEARKWKEVKSAFTHFAENDVAVAKITPCFENSKAGIFRGLINGIGAGTTELHIFRGNIKYILPDYVYLFFKSPNFLRIGETKMTGSAGQKRVPSNYVENSLFPLPPLAEQQRIITKVQQLQQQLSQLEAHVQQSREYAHQLLQSILKEAFEQKGKEYMIVKKSFLNMVAE